MGCEKLEKLNYIYHSFSRRVNRIYRERKQTLCPFNQVTKM